MALPNAGSLTIQQLTAVQKLAIVNGGTRRGAMAINNMGYLPGSVKDKEPAYEAVNQIDTLKFYVGAGVHYSVWEWLINSPYEVKMETKSQIEFLDPAGAVAFKLMFVKGPRDGTSSNNPA